MKCQILFTGKNKKNIINLSSAENAQRVVNGYLGRVVSFPGYPYIYIICTVCQSPLFCKSSWKQTGFFFFFNFTINTVKGVIVS